MKRILMLALALSFVVAAYADAASTFTLSQSDLLSLTLQDTGPWPVGAPEGINSLISVTPGPTYSGGSPMAGAVGYYGHVISDGDGWVEIGKTGLDLTTFTEFALTLYSDDDDAYGISLYAIGTVGGKTLSSTTVVPGHGTAVLSLDLSGYGSSDLSSMALGFKVISNKLQSDDYYVSASPVTIPVPGALVLGGLGTAIVGWLRRKRTVA